MNKQELLKKHAKAIVHMRQQLSAGKFGLVFGAGISRPFKIPNWNELIQRIAEDVEVDGIEILNHKNDSSPQSSLTQMLYEHFRAKEIENETDQTVVNSKEFEKTVNIKWMNIIHRELWKDFNHTLLEKDQHPYLDSLIKLVKESSLTINYNFDDTIQQLLWMRRTDDEKDDGVKNFETVWDAKLQFQRNKGIIYHPNGFLPFLKVEGTSNFLVFSEDSFADQLIASMSGHYSTLLHHLSKNTCLFIGLSIEDNTLKHLLRQSSILSPGHYHYYVAYTEDSSKLTNYQRNAILESNFKLYNLVTLFLDNEGIKHLGELIQMKETDLHDLSKKVKVPLKYIYYITGSVGCGKTTTLSYFRNLSTHSEWPDPKDPLLALPYNDLTDEQREKVDAWIASMFYKKNKNLRQCKYGINVIDRTPLDPLTFTDKGEWKNKATLLDNQITDNGVEDFRIEPGAVILLKGDQDSIARRIKNRIKSDKQYTSDDIKAMYCKFDDFLKHITPVTEIDVNELSEHDVVKRVAKVIHLNEYHANDLHIVLDKIKES